MGNDTGYFALRRFTAALVNVFFRQVDVVGEKRIPESGPVIFVANHNNQFVDPMMLIMNIPRVVRFLIAAKSLGRPVIGRFAKMAKSIGVARPQDLAKAGRGTVSAALGATVLEGVGTQFTKDLGKGFTIKAANSELLVKSIESDTQCTVSPCELAFDGAAYKIVPKVDQSEVYDQVHEALRNGDTIGIFPEGGSHDQTNLLDLKPGVAIMALGAMQAGAGSVQIVPVGLTYFEPYKFRSHVVVEFGAAIEVPVELAKEYESDKRAAVGKLMKLVDDGMHSVVLGTNDYEELQGLITARALWKPQGHVLSPEESLKVTKSFAKAGRELKGNVRVDTVFARVKAYNHCLKAAGVRDRDVRKNQVGKHIMAGRTLSAFAQVVFLTPLAVPFIILFLPIAAITVPLAKREKATALAGSNVKVKGLDVVASYKILVSIVVVPLYNVVLCVAASWYLDLSWLFSLVCFVMLPFVGYIGIRIVDRYVRVLVFTCTGLFFFIGKEQRSLAQDRASLVQMLRELVEELGPTVVDDFERKRIIRRTAIEEDTQRVLQKVANDCNDSALVVPLLMRKDS